MQLPNIFQDTKGKVLKVTAPQSKHYKQKAKKDSVFPRNDQTAVQNKTFTKPYMQKHTMTDIVNHSRSTDLERSVKILLGA